MSVLTMSIPVRPGIEKGRMLDGQTEIDATWNIAHILKAIGDEVIHAKTKHPGNFHNQHEGYAVLLEEVDELWDEIKKNGGGRDAAARKAAIQIAAMCVRYILEVCD